jgi:AcrR family transcriptional regulator
MPRSPSTNRDIRDSRRADILKAATKLFARRGLTDTKIGDIAAEAGLSHGLVYHYFPSKEAIFEAILEDKREAAWGDAERTERELGIEAAMRLLLTRAVTDASERPETSLMITQALLNDAVPLRVRKNLTNGAHQALLRSTAFFERAQKAGVVDGSIPASELAALTFCLVRGMFVSCAAKERGTRAIPVPRVETILALIAPRDRQPIVLAPQHEPSRPGVRARPSVVRTKRASKSTSPKSASPKSSSPTSSSSKSSSPKSPSSRVGGVS